MNTELNLKEIILAERGRGKNENEGFNNQKMETIYQGVEAEKNTFLGLMESFRGLTVMD